MHFELVDHIRRQPFGVIYMGFGLLFCFRRVKSRLAQFEALDWNWKWLMMMVHMRMDICEVHLMCIVDEHERFGT